MKRIVKVVVKSIAAMVVMTMALIAGWWFICLDIEKINFYIVRVFCTCSFLSALAAFCVEEFDEPNGLA